MISQTENEHPTENKTTNEKILAVLAILPCVMLRGHVLTKFWLWFFIPTFHAPPLHIASACGLALTLKFLTDNSPWKRDLSLADSIVNSVLRSVVALLCGWIFYLFT